MTLTETEKKELMDVIHPIGSILILRNGVQPPNIESMNVIFKEMPHNENSEVDYAKYKGDLQPEEIGVPKETTDWIRVT